MTIDEDKYIKKLICERYENCFQCPLGKDNTDNEGNLINICTYESDTIKTIAKDFVNKCNSNKSLCCNLKLGYDDCCEFDKYVNLMPTSSLMIRLSDSFEYEDDKKIFNGVIDVLPYQSQHNYVEYAFDPEVNSWDCASVDYNKDDKFIFFEKKDLIVMRDLLDAAIKAYDTGNLNVDIDKLDAILKS